MNRTIRKAAVLGSGVMGSRIACHLANVGIEVLLLDIVPRELNAKESAKGLTLESPAVRNRIGQEALQTALKSSPSPIYRKSFANRITVGNLDDDLHQISSCDWVIEAVIENLDIKKSLFARVDEHRKPGSLITTNTSGIPINLIGNERSEDFQAHFCGTHFFNPPRYLALLEIIPGPKTNPEIIDFLMDYGQRFLGKTTVLCKDTPAFIANRIGVYSIMALFHQVAEMGLSVDEVDKLTGPVMGRPKSATFRTCDVVGLDTLVRVSNDLEKHVPNDESVELFAIPDYIKTMVEKGWLGSKTKQGFYKKVKDENGKSQILSLDLNTMEYGPKKKTKFATLGAAKAIDSLPERLKVLFAGKDTAGEFYRKMLMGIFKYVSFRIPEITDAVYKIDDALRAGFGYQTGPFETWDILGVEKVLGMMKEAGQEPAAWIEEMISGGNASFYRTENGQKQCYNPASKSYEAIPGQEDLLDLDVIRDGNTVWKNSGTTITDLGDGILNLEFHTKMNTIGGEILQGINKAIDLAEKDYKGLVISNKGENFSAGANVGMIFMLAIEQEVEELNMAVRTFQNTVMRLRYSSIPVVVAPHGLTLGGGCEICLHADKVIAHAETYMGLVEFGIGVIPAGGGTKEFALRLSDEMGNGDIRTNTMRDRFLTIGQAQVSTSGHEAFDKGYLRDGIDEVIVSRQHQLAYAKEQALELYDRGYTQPVQRKDIEVLGNEGMGVVYVGANSMKAANYISEHDQLISQKLGYVLCGGDLSSRTKVSEQYLLRLEREAFVNLCMQRKTLERMESLIKTGKILRN